MLVMPAIHELKGRLWGWHRMSDLTIAVNNLFKQQGDKTRLKPMELVKRFLALTHDGRHLCGIAWMYRGRSKWLGDCVCLHDFSSPGAFVPTGWGIAVINAVKRGAVKMELVVKVIPANVGLSKQTEPVFYSRLLNSTKQFKANSTTEFAIFYTKQLLTSSCQQFLNPD